MNASSRRTVSLILGFIGLVPLALLAASCSALDENLVLDWSGVTERSLLAEGVDEQVVSCVLELAEDALDRGPLDDVVVEELVLNCRSARTAMQPLDENLIPDMELALMDVAWTFGDDPELDRLWTACKEGDGGACDELFEQSPLGSDYEDFGVSCGDRPDVLDCAQLAELE